MPYSFRKVADSDIRLLGVFHKIVECGGLTAAELDLNIGRSTISRHLKDLEVRLGVTLCRRGRSNFGLTPEGEEVYEASLALFGRLDQFRSTINGIQENIKGSLKLGIFDKVVGNPDCKLHRAIEAFNKENPAIKIEIHVDPLNELEKKVIRGEYDLGIVPTHRRSACLEYLNLFTEKVSLFCGRGHEFFDLENHKSLTVELVRNTPFATMGFNSPNMELCERLGIRSSAVAYNQEGVAVLVRSGRFLGFLPNHYASHFLAANEVRLVECEDFSYQCDFAMIHPTAIAPERATEVFMTLLADVHGTKYSSTM
ncbi:MAG: LysR family transcriptional regulator [Arenicella sp.]|nr:LysR family transcriptional regulator [Arenicella sp.]